MSSKKFISQVLGSEMKAQVDAMSESDALRLATVMSMPNVQSRVNRTVAPFGVKLFTSYGSVLLDSSLANIQHIYVNGQRFNVTERGMDGVEKAVGTESDVMSILGSPEGRQRSGRKVRPRSNDAVPFDAIQKQAFNDLNNSGITYDSLFSDLSGLMSGRNMDLTNISDELFSNKVSESDIARFLVYESQYKTDIISQVYGVNLGTVDSDYNFEPVTPDDSFVGRLMSRLNIDEALYDEEAGVLRVGNRDITNLPIVDSNGVFHNGDTRYIPHYMGYFESGSGTRAERLRVVDPVAASLDSLALHYNVTDGDVKFKTILDVTRNLPDFDNHPFGAEILETLKNKVVIDKSYDKTNSLLADYTGKADDLGAVALTILDDDARGLIDPLGTANGSNMGRIMFFAKGVQVNPDGTLVKSDEIYSPVGDILKDYGLDKDNFNRNQMSFNAFLTSTDVKVVSTAYMEFGLWNSEDAVVMTDKGARVFDSQKFECDKIMDFHGNKSVISHIIDSTMSDEEATEKRLYNAVKTAQLNPDLDLIVSPISISSRLNLGVVEEGLVGPKSDLHLPNGDVIKSGITSMMYMSLPQTAEHKSKDYSVEGNGRRYSTLLRYALMSKVGVDLYSKALIDPEVRKQHIDEIVTAFNRLGVSFKDNEALLVNGNVEVIVDSPTEVDASSLRMLTPSVIRSQLMNKMVDGQINIALGDDFVISPLTNQPITDSFGENVLPIRVDAQGTIPYRYSAVFEAISLGNSEKLQEAYASATVVDYRSLTRKDNLLKNIDTMSFTNNAHTDVLAPDPRLKLGEVRSTIDSNRLIIHRDPAIQSGNGISVDNVKEGPDNAIMVNPLIETMMDADNDGDTLGANSYDNLTLSEDEKEEFFNLSSVEEQVNRYGRVFLGTDSGHFKAAVKVNGFDDSNITFEDNKSNKELVEVVDNIMRDIVDSPASYGAYAISFEDAITAKNTLSSLADDGIKGSREDIERVFENGYTTDENRAILKALIAKSEWTGLAGATTNNLISGLGTKELDKDMLRVSMDVTHAMTQSVLQMKKNADKLPVIDKGIKDMKAVMSGKFSTEESRDLLKSVTEGLIEPEAIDKFIDSVSALQDSESFGSGVINKTETTTMSLAYVTGQGLGDALKDMSDSNNKSL